MGFCQRFRYFSDRIKYGQVAEIKLNVLLFKQYSSQSQKKNGVYKAFDHKRYQPGMNLRIPPAVGQKLSVSKGILQKQEALWASLIRAICRNT